MEKFCNLKNACCVQQQRGRSRDSMIERKVLSTNLNRSESFCMAAAHGLNVLYEGVRSKIALRT